MNTEIFDYIKNLSKRDFFAINLINSVLGVAIIVLAILGLIDGISMSMYAFMFGAGSIMLFLNFYKGIKKNNKNKWVFLTCAILFAAICGLFFYAIFK